MKTIYMHVGVPKTGTKSFQEVLLEKSPAAITPHRYRGSAFRKVLDHSIWGTPHLAVDLAAPFAAEFLSGGEDVFVSEEQLMGPPFLWGRFFPAIPRLIDLIEGLRRRGWEVEVLMVMRPHAAFLKSWYLQTVGDGYFADDFSAFVDRMVVNPFSWSEVLAALLQAGVAPTLLPYRMMIDDADAFAERVNRFYRGTLRFTAADFRRFHHKGINEEVYRIMRAVSALPDKQLTERVSEVLRAAFIPDYLDPAKGPGGAPPKIASPFLEQAIDAALLAADAAFAAGFLPKDLWLYWK